MAPALATAAVAPAAGSPPSLPLLLLATFFVLGTVTFVGAVQIYSNYSKDLQDPKQLLETIPYNQQTVLLDRTGTVQLAVFGSENRRVLKFSDIPAVVLDATTSAEDKTFWSNTGFDPAAILSALRDALSGHPRGASTITQQLVRQQLLPPTTSTVDRKIKEIIQSIRLTQEFPAIRASSRSSPPTSTSTSTATRATASRPRRRATSGSRTSAS